MVRDRLFIVIVHKKCGHDIYYTVLYQKYVTVHIIITTIQYMLLEVILHCQRQRQIIVEQSCTEQCMNETHSQNTSHKQSAKNKQNKQTNKQKYLNYYSNNILRMDINETYRN